MDALRDQRGLPWLEDLARDVRYGLRTLRGRPMFATVVVLLTLAIGIGANTAVFSVVNSVLLKPLAYPNAEELVAVWHTAPGAPGLSNVSGDLRLSASMYFTYAETQPDVPATSASGSPARQRSPGIAEPEEVRTLLVTDGTLQALASSRCWGAGSRRPTRIPDAPRTVMLGYGYWQRRFGGDRSVIGRGYHGRFAHLGRSSACMPEGFRVGTARSRR